MTETDALHPGMTEAEFQVAKGEITDFLGDVVELPLLFEGRVLCPGCLWIGTLHTAGGGYLCLKCGFRCKATVVLTKQGRRWMALNETI